MSTHLECICHEHRGECTCLNENGRPTPSQVRAARFRFWVLLALVVAASVGLVFT